jgi:hypothetical protein
MRQFLVYIMVVTAFSVPVSAWQSGSVLSTESLDRLAAKAVEKIDINLSGPAIQEAVKMAPKEKAANVDIQELVSGLTSLQVKQFEFANAGEYSASDLDPIRDQLRAPGWSKIVDIHEKGDGETVEVFTKTEGSQMTALAVIVAEPKELVVVAVEGRISLEKVGKLTDLINISGLGQGKEKSDSDAKPRKP